MSGNFIPHVFIGIGRDYHFFTLRQTYQRVVGRGTSVLSEHVKNLSQNADDAIEEAQEYARRNGVILKVNRDELPDDLDVIRRQTVENREQKARRAAEKIEEEKKAKERAITERRLAQESLIKKGIFPFGKHEGENFADHKDYLRWMVRRRDEFEAGSILEFLAHTVITQFPDLLQSPYNDAYLGTVGKRITVEGKVVNVRHWDGYYGRTYFVSDYWCYGLT